MIYLITGSPGDGKTLYALNFVKAMAEKENRPVFYSGIPDLRLPWTEVDADKWFDCPAGAIIVIDECQRLLRPRSYGSSVPQYVSAFETHRHTGHDVFLITQHPMLMDVSVRRLAKRHFHCMRRFGFQASTVHEFIEGVRDNPEKNREGSVRHDFLFPRESYGWYKSAELHTHKVRIPARLYLLAVLPLVLGVLAWYLWRSMSARFNAPAASPQVAAGVLAGGSGGGVAPGARPAAVMTAGEFLQAQAPRVPGLAYTAPAYDQVTQVTQAPYPAACVVIRGGCQCWSQQGTRLQVPDGLCRSIVSGGFFVAWDSEGRRVERRPAAVSSSASVPAPQRPEAPSVLYFHAGGLGGTPSTSPRSSGQPAAAIAGVAQ